MGKGRLSAIVKTRIDEDYLIQEIEILHFHKSKEQLYNIADSVVNMQDRGVHRALIDLGWTPLQKTEQQEGKHDQIWEKNQSCHHNRVVG